MRIVKKSFAEFNAGCGRNATWSLAAESGKPKAGCGMREAEEITTCHTHIRLIAFERDNFCWPV